MEFCAITGGFETTQCLFPADSLFVLKETFADLFSPNLLIADISRQPWRLSTWSRLIIPRSSWKDLCVPRVMWRCGLDGRWEMRRAVVPSCAEPNGHNQGECWDCEMPAKCREKTGDTTKELLSKAGAINHIEESGGKAGDQPRSTHARTFNRLTPSFLFYHNVR